MEGAQVARRGRLSQALRLALLLRGLLLALCREPGLAFRSLCLSKLVCGTDASDAWFHIVTALTADCCTDL